MRKIQALALFVVLLFAPTLQPWADAARPRTPQEEEPAKPTVTQAFQQKLQADPFLSDQAQKALNDEIAKYIDDLLNRKDKAEYVEKNQLKDFVLTQQQKLQEAQEKKDLFIQDILQNYTDMDAQASVDARKQMEDELDARLTTTGKNLERLKNEIETKQEDGLDLSGLNWKLIGLIIGGLLFLGIIIVIVSKSKGKKKPNTYNPSQGVSRPAKPG